MAQLEVKDLHVSIDGKRILNGISLEVNKGEVVALMGPNGSGKSTLAYALMGSPNHTVESGKIMLEGEEVTGLSPDKRAKKGLFLSFQYPSEIPGVSVANFLRTALNSINGGQVPVKEFMARLKEKMRLLEMDESFARRYLNAGFSGGEKKRAEMLQMAVLQPKIAILDETDSGTDVDALKIIANGINKIKEECGTGILLITHYNRILKYVRPDRVYVVVDGKIVKIGDHDLADRIEAEGYRAAAA